MGYETAREKKMQSQAVECLTVNAEPKRAILSSYSWVFWNVIEYNNSI